ncbi:hypothetical protein [Halobacillus litoralis]|uniref:hypothetical protein n=1 Tax=Halobacillus litoralis TaxID=45668 RepID=UPI001CD4A80C|nr:hypothetical protein [Halobacillus litoralis]MCA1023662.1 hypothetical protein [Halobacillus litoralis]
MTTGAVIVFAAALILAAVGWKKWKSLKYGRPVILTLLFAAFGIGGALLIMLYLGSSGVPGALVITIALFAIVVLGASEYLSRRT